MEEEFEEELIEDEPGTSAGMNDFESVPDDVTGSKSLNDDDMLAELIAGELMQQMIENYKNDDHICDPDKDANKIDEEEFKDKFPWTLDRIPEPAPKPKKAAQPQEEDITGGKKEELMQNALKKVKTEREI